MDNTKINFSVLGKFVICLLMCVFTIWSFFFLFTSLSVNIIGETRRVYAEAETEGEQEIIDTYDYMFENGEDKDTKKTEYEAQGYKVETVQVITGPIEGVYKVLAHTVSQVVCLFFFIVIVPHELYKQGQSDRNKVQCGYIAEDLFRGIKLGLGVVGVNLASWVCLLLAKLGVFSIGGIVYRYANYHLYGLQQFINFDAVSFGAPVGEIAYDLLVNLNLGLVPTALTVLVCWLTYLLGYKDINLYEKLVYKKK